MALLSLLNERRQLARARALAAEGRTTEAIALLDQCEGSATDALRDQLRRAAVDRWCDAAERAAERGEGTKARERLERARRYAMGDLKQRVVDLDRRLRMAQLRATRAEHWGRLLDCTTSAQPNDAWVAWSSPALLASAGRALQEARSNGDSFPPRSPRPEPEPEHEPKPPPPTALTEAQLLELTSVSLRVLRGTVIDSYPEDLVHRGLDTAFVEGALWLALGRPDLAALPLVESDDRQPLVCFELARVAHLLGQPDIARTALHGFTARAGGHQRVRRLHTGVFLAQMQLSCNDPTGAMATLDAVPIRMLGGRPALMYARLLLDHDQAERAAELLEEIRSRDPELAGAGALLDEARSMGDTTDG